MGGLRWLYIVMNLQVNLRDKGLLGGMEFLYRLLWSAPQLEEALAHTPLLEADAIAVGHPVDFYRECLTNLNGDEEFWQDKDHLIRFDEAAKSGTDTVPPILWVGGWLDFFLNQILRDFAKAQKVQPKCRLVI